MPVNEMKLNSDRVPQVAPHLTEADLLNGVPEGPTRRATSLVNSASDFYGHSAGKAAWDAIPWMPDLGDWQALPDEAPLPAIPDGICAYGVPIAYLDLAAQVYCDVVEMYDEAEAQSYWGKMPFLPPLDAFQPASWTVARGGGGGLKVTLPRG